MTDISHLKLITRLCACGCGGSFRVLPSSTHEYCGAVCADRDRVFDLGLSRKVTVEEKARITAQRKRARARGRAMIAAMKGKAA